MFYTPFKPEEIGPENSNEKFNALQKTMTLNPWDGRLTRELQFVKRLRDTFPQVDVRDCSALVWDLRKIKSPAEIEVLRRAGRIGVLAHNALIQTTRPGLSEKALEAVFEFVCRREGAADMAYAPILMSGKNHAFGHYHAYDRTLKAGDFVILDAGPDYADYRVDISTTFPASGVFSPRQKELYEAALAVREVCLRNYRPGVTFRQVGAAVEAMLKERRLETVRQGFFAASSATAATTTWSEWPRTTSWGHSPARMKSWRPGLSSPATSSSSAWRKRSASGSRTPWPSPNRGAKTSRSASPGRSRRSRP